MAARKPGAVALSSLPRAAGLMARAACVRAREARVDLAPLLSGASLTPAQMNDARATLVARDQVRFIDAVAHALGDDVFGLSLARDVELRQAGALYYVMASSETVLEALQRGVRYWSMFNEGLLQRCTAGRHLDLTLQHVGSSRHQDRHTTEFWAAVIVRVVRQLTGIHITPVRVRFVHARAHQPAELARYFGGAIEFNARADDIRFAGAVAATPLTGADPYLNRVLVAYCEDALAHRRPARGSFRSRTENAIVPLLPHGEASATAVARRLGMSERTFARKLAAEGLTYSKVTDELKLDLANRYLAEPGTSISEVAWLLGYREPSSFSKAFRRWTGKPPREGPSSPL